MPCGVYPRASPESRFWARVQKTSTCWNWIGTSIAAGGYGAISVKRRMIKAHRFSYILHFGFIPDSAFICHTCDNPKCVNPSHLFAGSPADNVRDMHNKGRARKAVGVRAGKTKLTPEQVLEIRELFPILNISFAAMGRRYGVKHSAISNILRGKNWKHL